MKFKVDENLPAEFVGLLQAAGQDAMTVVAQQMGGADDPVVARCCREDGRAIVTLD